MEDHWKALCSHPPEVRKHCRQANNVKLKKLRMKKLIEPKVQEAFKDALASSMPSALQEAA